MLKRAAALVHEGRVTVEVDAETGRGAAVVAPKIGSKRKVLLEVERVVAAVTLPAEEVAGADLRTLDRRVRRETGGDEGLVPSLTHDVALRCPCGTAAALCLHSLAAIFQLATALEADPVWACQLRGVLGDAVPPPLYQRLLGGEASAGVAGQALDEAPGLPQGLEGVALLEALRRCYQAVAGGDEAGGGGAEAGAEGEAGTSGAAEGEGVAAS